MTEKSASVGLLLATALLIKVPHRRSSLSSAAQKIPFRRAYERRCTNKSTSEFLQDKSSPNSSNAWPPFSFHSARFLPVGNNNQDISGVPRRHQVESRRLRHTALKL